MSVQSVKHIEPTRDSKPRERHSSVPPPPQLIGDLRAFDRQHPVCRGDFLALVFCGLRQELAELAGEVTAWTPFKFALADSRLDSSQDFARASGRGVPLWPQQRIEQVDGVCFVFADQANPLAAQLLAAGARRGEHIVFVDEVRTNEARAAREALTRFTGTLDNKATIGILGFGQQGQALAAMVRDQCHIEPSRILIYDSNTDSQHLAQSRGFGIADRDEVIAKVDRLIYSPLARFDALIELLEQARRKGLPVLDNSRRSSGLHQFVDRGSVRLEAAADRALRVDGGRIWPRPHNLALNVSIVRHDTRRIGRFELPHLHSGHVFSLHESGAAIACNEPAPTDPLDPTNFVRAERAYASVRSRADLGFFAARDFCNQLWPQATNDIFPAEHVVDLGMTEFERLLQNHIDGREIVSTMQTPAQRVALGVASRGYADNHPIIEIGSALGGSALLMAAATGRGRTPIHSIDPDVATRDIMRFAFQRHGWLDRLHQIIKTSDEAIAELCGLRGKAGLVFIDGLHTFDAVIRDFENYAPLVAPGGALLFHDVAPQIHTVFEAVIGHVLRDERFVPKCLIDGLMILERCT